MLNLQHVGLLKIREQKNQDKHSLRSNVHPNYNLQTPQGGPHWTNHLAPKKVTEIKSRAATLGDIQNKITESLLYVYQGAKLGGEVSNMKKETIGSQKSCKQV